MSKSTVRPFIHPLLDPRALDDVSADKAKRMRLHFEPILSKLGPKYGMRAAVAAACMERAEPFREQWNATSNPIWVWRCIAEIQMACVVYRGCHENLSKLNFFMFVPDWCRIYVSACALQITSLSNGFQFGAQREKENELDPRARLSAVPAAMMFSRKGWNAFSEYSSEEALNLWVRGRAICAELGIKFDFPLEAVMERNGWTDERSARRRVSKLRRRMAKLRG